MENSWNNTIDDIAKWVAGSQGKPDVRFSHIKGPAATAKGVKVPLGIWKQLLSRRSNVAVMHVLGTFKKKQVADERITVMNQIASESGQSHVSKVVTLTYLELLDMLKSARQSSG
ncbi:hypothetical protein ACJ41O_013261 [Fusarium nematophilum]